MPWKKFILPVLLISTLLSLALFSQNSHAKTKGSVAPLTTLRLTDRESTFYWATDPVVLAGNYGAHVIWAENIENFDDSDLFYAQLPAGTVTRLTDRTATIGTVGKYLNPTYKAVLDDSDNLFVIWSEDVGGSELQDLFFWKTGMTTPANISDHDLSNGDVGNLFLVLDSNNKAHALWAEAVNAGTFQPNIFYWSEATGATQKVSLGAGLALGQFNVTQALVLEVQGNTVHALWQDLDENGSGDPEPFYWNSQTGVAQPIRESGLPASEAFLSNFFFDDNGTFHAAWSENYFNGSNQTDYYYWNSSSGVNLQLPNPLFSFKADGNGNGHAYYTDGGVYHFDTVSQTGSLIPGLPATSNILEVGNGRIGDHFHMLWQAEDTNFPGHLNDLFYWHSDMTEPINITDHSGTPAEPESVRMVVDETDTVHIVWNEATPFYFNSQANMTTQPPASLSSLFIGRVVSKNGVAYVEFSDSGNDPPFYIWQSDDNSITPASLALGDSTGALTVNGVGSATSSSIWLDSNDQIHLTTDNIVHWDAMRGLQDLTLGDEMEPMAENGSSWKVTDSVGGSYIIWQGSSPVDDGLDMYAAFVSPELANKLYLPLVTKP
ncbi:MAG: hypothetical protein DHS20C20_18570 [Ardenticatenaceae bacterium]|nr:MAG: hypothetical protein DHS20C20_18570 [Ardenticatenaceae bacterium]